MCQYSGSALLDKNHVILNYTDDLLLLCNISLSV